MENAKYNTIREEADWNFNSEVTLHIRCRWKSIPISYLAIVYEYETFKSWHEYEKYKKGGKLHFYGVPLRSIRRHSNYVKKFKDWDGIKVKYI